MTSTQRGTAPLEDVLNTTLIRDLVEIYPEVMPVLSGYGIDVCCSGGLTVPAAAEAHKHDVSVVVDQVLGTIRTEEIK